MKRSMQLTALTAMLLAGTFAGAQQSTHEIGDTVDDGWRMIYKDCAGVNEEGTETDCMIVSENKSTGEVKVKSPEKCGGATRIRRKPQKVSPPKQK